MNRPFIVAEMSGNHNASLERALKIAEAAATCACSALKLQTYTADSLTIDCDKPDFVVSDENSLWSGETLYTLYQKAATPYEWHRPIFEYCKKLKLPVFSTPFDLEAVDFLEELDCPFYKIASFENSYPALLEKVASTKKPIIISLGMLGVEQIEESVGRLRRAGCTDLTLLKCTSTYPADPKESNLLTISDLKKRFPDCRIGLSDHTTGIGVALAAIGVGATVIEKHFTLSRSEGGVDSAFSLEPSEMKLLVQEARKAFDALGCVSYEMSAKEKLSLRFRRSLYIVKDIKAGERLSCDHVKVIRPGYGANPTYYAAVIGKVVKRDLFFGDRLVLEDLV